MLRQKKMDFSQIHDGKKFESPFDTRASVLNSIHVTNKLASEGPMWFTRRFMLTMS